MRSRCVFHCSRPTKQWDGCAPSEPFPRISNQRRMICLSALSVWQQPYWQLTPPSSSEGTVVSLSPRPLPRGCVLYIKNYKSQTRQRGDAPLVIKAMQFFNVATAVCAFCCAHRFTRVTILRLLVLHDGGTNWKMLFINSHVEILF